MHHFMHYHVHWIYENFYDKMLNHFFCSVDNYEEFSFLYFLFFTNDPLIPFKKDFIQYGTWDNNYNKNKKRNRFQFKFNILFSFKFYYHRLWGGGI